MIGTTAFRFLALFALILTSLLAGCNKSTPTIAGAGFGDTSPSADAVPLPRGGKPDVATTIGVVDEIDYVSMRLRVGHAWFWGDVETELDLPGCEPGCAFGDVQLGDTVKVKHDRNLDSRGYYAREIEVEEEDDEPEEPEDGEAETDGEIQVVDGDRLMVAGIWFWTDASTELEIDGCDDGNLRVGDRVKIEHSTSLNEGMGFYAFKIEIKRECDDEE